MKKDGSYRYNLKFSCEEKKNVRAGELLERLGHRKSAVVVEALNEYLDRHPALEQGDCEIHDMEKTARTMPPDNWMEIVARMIEEKVGLVREQKYDEPETEQLQAGRGILKNYWRYICRWSIG